MVKFAIAETSYNALVKSVLNWKEDEPYIYIYIFPHSYSVLRISGIGGGSSAVVLMGVSQTMGVCD